MDQILQKFADANDDFSGNIAENNDKSDKRKLKYVKHSEHKNGLDTSKIKLQKYDCGDIAKLKEKYRKKKSIAHVPFNFTSTVENKQNSIDKDTDTANPEPNNIKQIPKVTSSKHRKHKKSKNNSDLEVLNISNLISPDKPVVQNEDDNTKSKGNKNILSPITMNETDPLSTKTPNKVNAFQFMMNSRFNVIGNNSGGKDKKEIEVDEEEIFHKKKVLNKRKAMFENWTEKKSPAAKRKLQDEAQEKYTVTTLNKRAKRLKDMLSISSGDVSLDEDTNDSQFNLEVKSSKNKTAIFSDSESSHDACVNKRNEGSSDSEQNLIELQQDTISFSNKVTTNFDKRKSMDDFVTKIVEESKSDGDLINENIQINDKTDTKIKENGKELAKVKLNLTPRKSKHADTAEQENTPKSRSRSIRKSRKSLLSLKKTDEFAQSDTDSLDITKTKKGLINTNCAKENDDDEIFPTKILGEFVQSDTDSLDITKTKKGIINTNCAKEDDDDEIFPTKIHGEFVQSDTDSLDIIKTKKGLDTNCTKENDDDEIFPTKMLVNKTAVSVEKKSRERKISNNDLHRESSNVEENNGKFTPRSWKMRVKMLEKENVSDVESNGSEEICIIDESPPKNLSITNLASVENSLTFTDSNIEKKQLKLAPIFLKKSNKQDQATIQAKKNFLYSGLPLSVKKTHAVQQSGQEMKYEIFPKISHIQQRQSEEPLSIFWDLPKVSLCFSENDTDLSSKSFYDKIHIGSFTDCKTINIPLKNRQLLAPPGKIKNIRQLIQGLKRECPDYPVYKIFRLLRLKSVKSDSIVVVNNEQNTVVEKPKEKVAKKRSRGRPRKKEIISDDNSDIILQPSQITSSQPASVSTYENMWTEKYKPQSLDDIMGNFSVVNELKLWLETWVTYSEDKISRKRKRLNSNSSDDFCSDNDTRDTDNSAPQNTMLLIGPYGSGKTSSVYALCNELNINVIEINASSKRSGKRILSELQEATQSHQVKNTDSKSVNNFFQKFSDNNLKSEDDLNRKLSLLLIEDVDLVFEDQDEGLISALVTLISTSKRPIILTSADPTSPHVQKFISQHRVITFSALSGNILGTWLQILCLVEGVQVSKDMVVRLLHWNKGDVRKTILQLQFWVQTGGDQLIPVESDLPKIVQISSTHLNSIVTDAVSYQDEGSNLSWLSVEDCDIAGSRDSSYVNESCVQCFVPYCTRHYNSFQIPYPVNLGLLWWNMPKFLGICHIKQINVIETREETVVHNDSDPTDFNGVINQLKEDKIFTSGLNETEIDIISPVLFEGTQEQQNQKKQCTKKELDDLNIVINMLDSISIADTMYKKMNLEYDSEPTLDQWYKYPVDSLSFKENMDSYDESNIVSMDIIHWLVETTIRNCETITNKTFINSDINVAVPESHNIRCRTRHHRAIDEISSIVPLSSLLERKGVCTDYHSAIRSISRIENTRFNNNSKRKNRFYHYFKNINVHLTDSTFRVLNNTLAINKDTI